MRSDMTDHNIPQVNLPDPAKRPITPGPNSWAQQQEKEKARVSRPDDGPPTIRDKYEHKPMPPPPPDEATLQPKAYIQPAIPRFNLPPNAQNQKGRAVTDPVGPKPLFATRKVSVKQLRKKYSQSKREGESPKPNPDDRLSQESSSSIIQVPSGKAARVLGVQSVEEGSSNVGPYSAPAAPTPDKYKTLGGGLQEGRDTPARKVQSSPVPASSTPVPTRRYLRENGIPDPAPPADASGDTQTPKPTQAPHISPEISRTEVHTPMNKYLVPPKVGTHTNVGAVGLVEGAGMRRFESFRGVIENTSDPNSTTEQSFPNSNANQSQPSTAGAYEGAGVVGFDVYSPSNYHDSPYNGVWENDPAVGYSLPPFSPMPRQVPQDPIMARHGGPTQNTHRFSHYQQPLPSANSWASGSKANSYSPSIPPSSAPWPPPWPAHPNNNGVPSPPHNQYDFQRSNSTPAALAQIELTLHHHLDTSFGSLTRLITNKHDQMVDQTLRRLDDMESTIGRSFKDMKNDFKDIRKQVGNIQGDIKDLKKRNDRSVELIKSYENKLEVLGKIIEEHPCKCTCNNTPDPSSSEPDSDRQHARSEASSNRRAESAHPIAGQSEARQQHRRGASRTSNNARMSVGSSSKRDRSNTLGSQQGISSRLSEDKGNRREYFTELEAARARVQVPDLREHPAYAGMQQAQAHDSGHDGLGFGMGYGALPSENPSLREGGWYHQAYGHNR